MKNLYLIKLLFIPLILGSILISSFLHAQTDAQKVIQKSVEARAIEFVENQGQFLDHSADNPSTHILFKAQMEGGDLYITDKGLKYYIFHTEIKKDEKTEINSKIPFEHFRDIASGEEKAKASLVTWERIDVNLEGASIKKENVVLSQPSADYFNYYYGHLSEGIEGVRSYKHIIIKDIYPGVDWEIISDGKSKQGFKTNFLVAQGSDYKQIKMDLKGPEEMISHVRGNLFSITTNLGRIEETAPVAYAGEDALSLQYTNIDGIIGFDVPDYDESADLIIDPITILWSTFYTTGAGNAIGWGIYSDGANVYATGTANTNSLPLLNLAGAYYNGTFGGVEDVIILKFDTGGVRQWATYYGGGVTSDVGTSIHFDGTNLFLGGYTSSADFFTVDPGGGAFYDATLSGGGDAFIAKFDAAGALQWSTYVGGDGADKVRELYSDGTYLWVVGEDRSTDFPLLDPGGGAYQRNPLGGAAFTAFIMKFTVGGVLKWSTEWGSSTTIAYGLERNGANLWVVGLVNSSHWSVTTLDPGGGAYYDNAFAGGNGDAFITQFDTAGVLLWATYYGGSSYDRAVGVTNDGTSLWVLLETYINDPAPSSVLPTMDPGGGAYFQGAMGNVVGTMTDAYIAEFDVTTRALQWATYFGGDDKEHLYGLQHRSGALWLAGTTYSSDNPVVNDNCSYFATDVDWATQKEDHFVAKFDATTRNMLYGSYFGKNGHEETPTVPDILSVDNNFVWLTGYTSGVDFPTVDPGGGAYYSSSVTSGWDAIIVKLGTTNCTTSSINILSVKVDNSCFGGNDGSIILMASGGTRPYTYIWSPNVSTDSFATGLTAGTYTIIVSDTGSSDTAVITINQPNDLVLSMGSTNVNCGDSNGTATISVSGGISPYGYQWSNGDTTTTIDSLSAGTYSVVVTDSFGCMDSTNVTIIDSSLIAGASKDTAICIGANVQLIATGGSIYSWSPSVGLNDTSIANPIATPTITTTYTVNIDIGSCSVIDTVTITVQGCIYFIPNTFTPNGDGKNDVFYVRGNGISTIDIIIYNRWGEKVFKTNDITQGWDGTLKGKILNASVFVYYVEGEFQSN